jgi:hypothetical protein
MFSVSADSHRKLSLRDAVNVRDSFESFDPANNLPGLDRAPVSTKLVLDDFPSIRVANGETDAPGTASCLAIQKCEGL